MKFFITILALLLITTLGFFVTHQPEEVPNDTLRAAPGTWYPDGNYLRPALATWGLRVPSLASCDTIDTDGDGIFSCGTDAGGTASVSYLSEIGDVSTTTLATGYVLKWSGTEWESVATSTLNITAVGDGTFSTTSADYWAQNDLTLGEINDVSTTSLATNDMLFWNGTNWVSTSTIGVTSAGAVDINGLLTMGGNNIDDIGDVTFKTGATGGTLRTGTSVADKFTLQAYDVNGGAYTTFLQADAGDDPYLQVFTDTFFFENRADPTKQARLDLSGLTTGNARTLTVQDSDGTIAYTSDITNASSTNLSVSGITDLATLRVSGLTTIANASSTLISGTSAWYTNFYGALTGNASTATALEANGANCASGNAPLGVDASGAVESCFDVWTEAENTSAGYTSYSDADVSTYLTGGTGITESSGTLSFDCSEVEGVGINCATEAITLDATGNWTGELDGYDGSELAVLAEDETVTGEYNFSTGTTTVSNLSITTAVSILGEYFTNFTTYVRSLFTGGDHITITDGSIAVDDDFLLNNGDTGTGTYDFGGAVMEIPNGTNPTISTAGTVGVNTTQASSTLRFHDGTAERSASDRYQKTLKISSSTILSLNGVNTGTTTIVLDKAILSPITHLTRYCETNTGNWSYRIGDGTSSSTVQTCTTTGANATITNGTFEFGDKIYLEIGSSTGSTVGTLIIGQRYDAD